MPEIEIRPMCVEDLDQVMEIERGSFSVPWSRGALSLEITGNQCARYLSLLKDSRVMAYAGMWLIIDEAHVTNIAVHESARGQGLGERVLRALVQLAADQGASQMTLEVRQSNKIAQALYQKLGFAPVGIRKAYYEDNKEDALLMTLSPLPDQREAEIRTFWADFLHKKGLPKETPYIECFHFDMTEKSSGELLSLTLRGEKRATCSAKAAFALCGNPLPKPGDYSIVTDFFGHPRCVIQTTAVEILPFHSVSWEMARREGEDDTLASWRQNHKRFFTQEGASLGYAFSPDMQVIFEDFVVVYR